MQTYRKPHDEQINTGSMLRAFMWNTWQQHLSGKLAAAPRCKLVSTVKWGACLYAGQLLHVDANSKAEES